MGSSLPNPLDVFEPGTLAKGRYHIVEQLGAGGMAVVFLVRDEDLHGRLAVLKSPFAGPAFRAEDLRARFEDEIANLIRVGHVEGVVDILDQGVHEGCPFYVAQWMGGGSLQDKLSGDGRQPAVRADAWLMPVARALDSVHKHKFVHRDVKPDNILFTEDDHARLADFGIARVYSGGSSGLTTGYTKIGTQAYWAPEQEAGLTIDGRADQFSLAATAYKALTGQPPATRGVPDPVRELAPAVTKACEAAIHKALEPKRENRFATCAAFAQAFRAGLPKTKAASASRATRRATGESESRSPHPPDPKPSARRAWARPVSIVLMASVIVAGALFATGVLPLQSPPDDGAPTAARPTGDDPAPPVAGTPSFVGDWIGDWKASGVPPVGFHLTLAADGGVVLRTAVSSVVEKFSSNWESGSTAGQFSFAMDRYGRVSGEANGHGLRLMVDGLKPLIMLPFTQARWDAALDAAESVPSRALRLTRVTMSRLASAVAMYRLANNKLPPSLESLAKPDHPAGQTYIDSVPDDEWGSPIEYRIENRSEYVLFSRGPDRRANTSDDVVYPRQSGAASPAQPDSRPLSAGEEIERARENLSKLLTRLVSLAKEQGWPRYSGKNFVLSLVAHARIDRRKSAELELLFSPSDAVFSLDSVDSARYVDVTKRALENSTDFHDLTSYAGRRNADKDHAITGDVVARNGVVMADMNLTHYGIVLLGHADGSVSEMRLEDQGIKIPDVGESILGDDASDEVLAALSDM